MEAVQGEVQEPRGVESTLILPTHSSISSIRLSANFPYPLPSTSPTVGRLQDGGRDRLWELGCFCPVVGLLQILIGLFQVRATLAVRLEHKVNTMPESFDKTSCMYVMDVRGLDEIAGKV